MYRSVAVAETACFSNRFLDFSDVFSRPGHCDTHNHTSLHMIAAAADRLSSSGDTRAHPFCAANHTNPPATRRYPLSRESDGLPDRKRLFVDTHLASTLRSEDGRGGLYLQHLVMATLHLVERLR
jgi:hypothetical protein